MRTLAAALLAILLSAAPAGALCVKATVANLRSGPGTSYDKLWEVYRYMPLERIQRRGDWYKVKDFEGDTYWIHRKLVTSRYKCAVVKVEKANVRSGPGTRYRQLIFSPVFKFYTFKVEKLSGDWAKVRDDYDDTGWIFRKLLWVQ